jgi:hypothetical protein
MLRPMSSKQWVLRCNKCQAECTYAEVTFRELFDYLLPVKPEVPPDFKYTCPTCGHSDSYQRLDLVYRDDEVTPGPLGRCS